MTTPGYQRFFTSSSAGACFASWPCTARPALRGLLDRMSLPDSP